MKKPSKETPPPSIASAPVLPSASVTAVGAMRRPRRVFLHIDSAFSYGRGVTEGVLNYAVTVGWRLQRHVVTIWSGVESLGRIDADGVIAMVFSPDLADRLKRMNVPVVNVSSAMSREMPSVVIDNYACGRMAARHFLERGFRRLGVLHSEDLRITEERYRGFMEVAQEHDVPVEVFGRPLPGMDHDFTAEQVRDGVIALREWLRHLPSPIGIYSIGDMPGTVIIDAAHDVGRHVPEEIAVVGTDDDPLTVNATLPPLSSVQVPSFAVGVEAAKMLDRLMDGQELDVPHIWMPPPGLSVRASSEILAISDPDVVLALRYIRDNVAAGIGVEDVMKVVPLSRRPLERKFRKLLNRTILNEIHRSRIERAKTLLVSTNLSVAIVATKSGFQSTNHFGSVFRSFVGSSPNRYKHDFGGASTRKSAATA